MDSMSDGSITFRDAPITPSIITRGSVFAPSVERPRRRIDGVPFGSPPGWAICKPATLPCTSWVGLLTTPWLKSTNTEWEFD